MTDINSIVVVAAIIKNENKILITRKAQGKSNAGKWELPGGKVKDGEQEKSALKREINEELGILIDVEEFFMANRHSYHEITIELRAYWCRYSGGTIKYTDHDRAEWVSAADLSGYIFSAADIAIIEKIQERV
ncbi:MAG: hypothetical protein A2W91_03265 [Bacteroidetes bacterium GWF2_38_335]|nr:MAG: hypothetical protein A2W91_03265 [Bacteroidetes bacterium GWF2_38_335]OFY77493.1 MAG: hypothetical protein A2281_01495 [Bacteroidetes bacterium RIFOXYA12_FULL_38_20]HBS87214.1 8-oxo-dGTP diphosphatase MutT [Bacteroidales bacterium]